MRFRKEMGRGGGGFAMSLFPGAMPFKELAAYGNPFLLPRLVRDELALIKSLL